MATITSALSPFPLIRALFCALTVFFSPLLAAQTSEAESRLEQLLLLMQERLELAEKVASSKWESGEPIEAPDREQQVLEQLSARAVEHSLPAETVQAFFQAQMDASKAYQQTLHSAWEAGDGGPGDSQDLGSTLRPAIDDLDERVLQALADWMPMANSVSAITINSMSRQLLDADAEAAQLAAAPLVSMRLHQSWP